MLGEAPDAREDKEVHPLGEIPCHLALSEYKQEWCSTPSQTFCHLFVSMQNREQLKTNNSVRQLGTMKLKWSECKCGCTTPSLWRYVCACVSTYQCVYISGVCEWCVCVCCGLYVHCVHARTSIYICGVCAHGMCVCVCMMVCEFIVCVYSLEVTLSWF